MRLAWSLSVILVMAALPTSVLAHQGNGMDQTCKQPTTTAEMYECTLSEWHSADRRMDAYYGRVLQSLHGMRSRDVQHLRKAQRAWEVYREADCKAELKLYEGGTAGSFNYNSCMEASAVQRLADLRQIYGWLMKN